MQISVTTAFEGLTASDAVQSAVWRHAAKLERYFNRVTSCRVVISRPQHGGRQGDLYWVRVDVTVPGGEIVVNREHRYDHAHEDVYVALRDAFRAARRQLEDHVRRMRLPAKAHVGTERGHATTSFPDQGYGFIRSPGTREVNCRPHTLVGADFSRLGKEDQVWFAEAPGEQGPQAPCVQVGARGPARPEAQEAV